MPTSFGAKALTWSISARGSRTFPTPDNIKQAAIKAMQRELHQVHAGGRHGGVEAGRDATGTSAEFGTSYKVSECIVTVGGKHVHFQLTQALVESGR